MGGSFVVRSSDRDIGKRAKHLFQFIELRWTPDARQNFLADDTHQAGSTFANKLSQLAHDGALRRIQMGISPPQTQ